MNKKQVSKVIATAVGALFATASFASSTTTTTTTTPTTTSSNAFSLNDAYLISRKILCKLFLQ